MVNQEQLCNFSQPATGDEFGDETPLGNNFQCSQSEFGNTSCSGSEINDSSNWAICDKKYQYLYVKRVF